MTDRLLVTLGSLVRRLPEQASGLARMIGGARQSVNQILRAFYRRGYVELSGRTILLKGPALLRRRAGL